MIPVFLIPPYLFVSMRKIRPYLTVFAICIWIIYRTIVYYHNFNPYDTHSQSSSTSSCSSLLQIILASIIGMQDRILLFYQDNYWQSTATTSAISNSMGNLIFLLIPWIRIVMEDMLAIILIHSTYRIWYDISMTCTNSYCWKEWKDSVHSKLYSLSIQYIPSIRQSAKEQIETFKNDLRVMLKKNTTISSNDAINISATITLPQKGRSQYEILQELTQAANQENKLWKQGKVSGTVYYNNEEDKDLSMQDKSNNLHKIDIIKSKQEQEQKLSHIDFLNQVYSIYSSSNPLHSTYWPKMNQCEAEVIAMVGNMLHLSPSYGCVTSGGTESIILAIRAYIKYNSNIRHPEIILSKTAHAAVWKACDLYNIVRPIVVDCNILTADAVRPYITCNTILIYASAPCYPTGVVDDIVSLSQLAQSYQIGLHVDACLGGFILAFCDDNINDGNVNGDRSTRHDDKPKSPMFDFRNPGVTSISIDTHKFGYASKGSSVLLYREANLRHAQYFYHPNWTGGLYVTPTIAGSRSGALSVCAWASMMSMGREGYTKHANAIVYATRKIADAIEQDIPQLQLLTKPSLPYMVVCFSVMKNYFDVNSNSNNKSKGRNGLNIYRIKDVLQHDFGWHLNELQNPASIHLCVTQSVAPNADQFIQDLKKAIFIEENKNDKERCNDKGSAGIYGTVANIPSGPVEHLLQVYTDTILSP